MNKMKLYGLLVLFAVSIFAMSATAAELEGPFDYGADRMISIGVEVNDVNLALDDVKNVEKTDQLDVLVTFKIEPDEKFLETYGDFHDDYIAKDVEIIAELTGYDHGDVVRDSTSVFDVKADQIYDKKLQLELPVRLEQDYYSLKIRVEDRVMSKTFLYKIDVESVNHLIEIKDIILSPENSVEAGRALLASVRVKNRGTEKEEDVKVMASIPELGISASDYIDQLDEEGGDDDSATSEELYMRIPDNVKSGEYDLNVEVEYDEGDEVVTATKTIYVQGIKEEKEQEEEKGLTKITAGPETQDLTKGEGKNYLITISNEGSSAKTYSVTTTGAVWADVEISPSTTEVIAAGDSKTFNIFVTPKTIASVGENVFTVAVTVDGTTQEITLKANVLESEAATTPVSLKRALEIVLVILVVLLVIIGLIIGFSKLKGKEESEEEKGSETYY